MIIQNLRGEPQWMFFNPKNNNINLIQNSQYFKQNWNIAFALWRWFIIAYCALTCRSDLQDMLPILASSFMDGHKLLAVCAIVIGTAIAFLTALWTALSWLERHKWKNDCFAGQRCSHFTSDIIGHKMIVRLIPLLIG